jgi:hypothetical protein
MKGFAPLAATADNDADWMGGIYQAASLTTLPTLIR